MEIIVIIAVVILLIWSISTTIKRKNKGSNCCGDKETPIAKIKVKDRNKSHYPYHLQIKIGGMVCENCVIKVENALNSLEDTYAKVNLSSKEATVYSKSKPDIELYKDIISKSGYIFLSTIE